MGCHFSYPTPVQLFCDRPAARSFLLLVENCLLLYGLLDKRLLDIKLIKRCLELLGGEFHNTGVLYQYCSTC
jgi:hypothetical protein